MQLHLRLHNNIVQLCRLPDLRHILRRLHALQGVQNAFCMVEKRQQDLDRINEQIAQRWETLHNLEQATEQLSMLEKDIKSAKFYFGIVERRARELSEKEM